MRPSRIETSVRAGATHARAGTRQPIAARLLACLLLALLIPASFGLSMLSARAIDRIGHLRLERLTSDVRHVIEARLRSYTDVLHGLQALFATHEPVDRVQFHRYVTALDLGRRYPGYDVVNFAVYVTPEDKARFEHAVRHDTSLDPRGYPDFRIKPPGDRSEYYVIVYVEPMQGFEFAFGLDLAANPAVVGSDSAALTALQHRARDSGALTASGRPIRIRIGDREHTGLAVRLAVYRPGMPTTTPGQRRAAYLGSVGAGFNIEQLMKGVLNEALTEHVRLTLHDIGTADATSNGNAAEAHWLLFDSRPAGSGVPDVARVDPNRKALISTLPLEFAGRLWSLRVAAAKSAVIDPVEAWRPWIVMLVALTLSLLVCGTVWSLASSRTRAVSIAAEMTRDLRASERELRALNGQLQALSRRLVDVQESDRREFARELHDRVGQNLTALSISLDILKSQLPPDAGAAVHARLQDAATLLESTAERIENVMSDICPPMLDDYGLLPAMQWYAKEFGTRTGLRVQVDGDETQPRLAQASEIALFRIVQEALHNAAKHGGAKTVHIRIERGAAECVLRIADDGVGFDPRSLGAKRRRAGLGMVTMRERAQTLGGAFEVRSARGSGTVITVRVPA
jgi:signal transduction histidine kinase